jgi:hypothetical protein
VGKVAFKSSAEGFLGNALCVWGALDVIGRIQTAVGIGHSLLVSPDLKVTALLIIAGPLLVWHSIRSDLKKNLAVYERAERARVDTKDITDDRLGQPLSSKIVSLCAITSEYWTLARSSGRLEEFPTTE